MIKNIIALGLSTSSKLAINAALLLILAKYMGLEGYGVIATCIAITSILSIILEFGYSTYIVKVVAEDRSALPEHFSQAIATKLYLSVIYIIFCLVVGEIYVDNNNLIIFYNFIIVTFLANFTDFINVGFRSVSKFYLEAKVNTISAFIHLLVIAPAAYFTSDLLMVSLAYLIVKLISLLLAYNSFTVEFDKFYLPNLRQYKFENVLSQLKKALHYGFDNAIVTLRSNIDTVIINSLLGHTSVGLYQAGMNIVKALERVGPIIANVYLPKLSRIDESFKYYRNQLFLLMTFVSFIFSIIISFIDFSSLLGKDYSELNELSIYLILYLVIRYLCFSFGVLMTSVGMQSKRVKYGIITLLISVAMNYILIPFYGLYGAVYTLIVSSFVLLLLFFCSLFRYEV